MTGAFHISELLLHERERTHDSGFLSLAAAYLEECDDIEYLDDKYADRSSYPAEYRNYHKDSAEDRCDLELERLSYMEHCIFRLFSHKKRDDDADKTEYVASHSEYLVIGDILCFKFSSMVVLIRCSLLILLLVLVLLLILLLLLLILGLWSRRGCGSCLLGGSRLLGGLLGLNGGSGLLGLRSGSCCGYGSAA